MNARIVLELQKHLNSNKTDSSTKLHIGGYERLVVLIKKPNQVKVHDLVPYKRTKVIHQFVEKLYNLE